MHPRKQDEVDVKSSVHPVRGAMPSVDFRGFGRGGQGSGKKLIDWMSFAEDQAASRIVLDNGTILTKCDQCRQMYGERKPPEDPPCESCYVELDKANEEAAMIYRLCQGQVITAGEQIIDINYIAVKTVMDIYKIKDQRRCLGVVARTFHHFENERRKKEK